MHNRKILIIGEVYVDQHLDIIENGYSTSRLGGIFHAARSCDALNIEYALAYYALKRYQAQNCEGCPLRSQCHKSKTNRIIEVNYKLNRYKQKAREKLMSEEGIYHRGRRCIEPEAVFAQIKHNSAWNRFRLRGLEKVKTEFTLVAIAHNLRKLAKKNSFLLFLTYFWRITFPKEIIEKTKDVLKIKMDNKRAA